ncbi:MULTISPECIES: PhzF family phenazine biosynthesis isomerase [unclassified Rhodococcus (in: high G+C Gram-positive bacteria)]|uniref:PhzF family phenazine biosynthesis isomerase n=1 Tax=unclassified Rhodococcus (in: high G+C Gram-positive bacteria) TaxID=192944 RepID=UPI00200AB66C|nr:PhzF family phenazine biosynthesis isomerase [Rhodococcus sp. HM1]MCK8675167.1 PhzF family phenazine biosynthesis isomerase [Rhodococcus sp. HM1]
MARVELYEAFAVSAGGGNPAGVVLDARELSDREMLTVAREVGASETAFVTDGDAPHTYRIRYFSPEVEVPFCGHATIATAIALAEHHGDDEMVMLTAAGRVPVRIDHRTDGLHASFTSVPPTITALSDDVVADALTALRWAPEDVDPRFPAVVSDAGSRHLVLAVATRDRLARLDYDFDALRAVLTGLGAMTAQLFWYASPREIHSRNPFPVGGVVEDPATGSAAAALGGYLRHLGMAHPGDRLVVHQGTDMGRPSEIGVEIGTPEDGITVSGRAVRVEPARRLEHAGRFDAGPSTHYVEHLRRADLSVGTYSIPAGAADGQQPHREDEIYVVTAGSATLWTPTGSIPAPTGAVLFVPAGLPHRFVDVTEDLATLVVSGPAEGTRA